MKEKKDLATLEAFFSLSFFSFSSFVTNGHDEPYLGIHIKNSVEHVGDVLPNPRTNALQARQFTTTSTRMEWYSMTGR